MAISSWDEFPVHQSPDWISHAGTTDRNFYDRNYFCMHGSSDELFAIFGMGQYPNLGVQDAFCCVRRGDKHHVVRGSRPLTDRMDMSVGPMRIEVIEPLKKVRFIVEPNEHSIAMDVTWDASIRAMEEPNQYIRSEGRVVFNTQRFAQLGRWEGNLSVGGEDFAVTPDRWGGARDRSWGIRPVGEPEGDGIRQGVNVMSGMWNYFPMMFDDHAILYMNNEADDGTRRLVEGKRVWVDGRPDEDLGRSEHDHTFESGTRVLTHSTISFPEAGIEIDCQPLLVNYVAVGTGYGMDADWRHGMYQGPDLVVQGKVLDVDTEVKPIGQYGVVDHVGRYTYEGNVGYGLYEHGFFGPFHRYGMADGAAGAP